MLYTEFMPNEKLKWKLAPIRNKPKYNFFNGELRILERDILYKTKLYNRKNIIKAYYIEIYLLYCKDMGYKTLYFRGDLSNWYYQTPLDRNLRSDEYDECLNFLLSEIGVPRINDQDMEKLVESDEFRYTHNYIQKHQELKKKKRNKRISKDKTTAKKIKLQILKKLVKS